MLRLSCLRAHCIGPIKCLPKNACSLLGINAYRTLLNLTETGILSSTGSISDIAVIANANIVLSPTMAVLAGFSTITIHTLYKQTSSETREQAISDLTMLALVGGVTMSALALCFGSGSAYMLTRAAISVPVVAVANVYIGKLLMMGRADMVWYEMVKAIGLHLMCLCIMHVSMGHVDATGAGVVSSISDTFLLCRMFIVSGSKFPSKFPDHDFCKVLHKPASMVTVNTLLFSGSQAIISKAVNSLGIIEIAAHQIGSLVNSLLTLTGDAYGMWTCVSIPTSKDKKKDILHILTTAHVTGVAVLGIAFALVHSVCPFLPINVADTVHSMALSIALLCSINTVLKVLAGVLTALGAFDKLLTANLLCISTLCLGFAGLDGMATGSVALQGIWAMWLTVCVLRYIYYCHSIQHHFF